MTSSELTGVVPSGLPYKRQGGRQDGTFVGPDATAPPVAVHRPRVGRGLRPGGHPLVQGEDGAVQGQDPGSSQGALRETDRRGEGQAQKGQSSFRTGHWLFLVLWRS